MVEISLKAAVASRTLDNITVVIICFKNFKKVLKSRLTQGQASLDGSIESDFKPAFLNKTLGFPNLDLVESDVERPEGQPGYKEYDE
jgi:hypothetical protein